VSTTCAELRATGFVALLAIAAIHFAQIVDTFREAPLLGFAYVALIAATVLIAARLVTADDPRAWIAAAALNAAIIVGYAFTRILGTAFDSDDVGNWACMLGLAALFAEMSVIVMSVVALRSRVAVAPNLQGVGSTSLASVRVSDAGPHDTHTANDVFGESSGILGAHRFWE
jgi:hypothetical protein